jgi:hypothetical protein
MSASDPKRTSQRTQPTSAFGGKAVSIRENWLIGLVPVGLAIASTGAVVRHGLGLTVRLDVRGRDEGPWR